MESTRSSALEDTRWIWWRPGGALRRALLLAALAVVAARFAWTALSALDLFSDYHAYYRAAANLRAGADLYAEGKELVARDDYGFWTQTDGQYVYPPSLALLLLPLTTLDIGKAGVIWLLLTILASFGLVWVTARLVGRAASLGAFAAVALSVIGVAPLLLGVRYGLVTAESLVPAALAALAHLALTRLAEYGASWGRRAVLALALTFAALAALALVLGARRGAVDQYLLKLAVPGLLGIAALNWRGARQRMAGGRALTDELATLAPIALPILAARLLLDDIRFGQVNTLLTLLTTLALLALLRRRDLLGGVALGVAAAIKPPLALYGLFLIRKGRWTALGAATLAGTTLGLVPFAALGLGALTDWFAISRYFSGGAYATYPINEGLRGLLLHAFVGGPLQPPLFRSRALADSLWLAAIIASLALWLRRAPGADSAPLRMPRDYFLLVALVLFAAPLTEGFHYVALLPALALLADRAARGQSAWRWAVPAALGAIPFFLPVADVAQRLARGDLARLLASGVTLYGLILIIGALVMVPPEPLPAARAPEAPHDHPHGPPGVRGAGSVTARPASTIPAP